MDQELADRILCALSAISVLPRRILLETPGIAATVPMLRGVWGAALHDLDPDVYAVVFSPNDELGAGPNGRSHQTRLTTQRAAKSPEPTPKPGGGAGRQPAVAASGTAVAAYILRPAPPDPEFAPAMDWILIGDAVQHDAMLCRAWDIASGMGLGPQRRRFHLRQTPGLGPDGRITQQAAPWSLDEAQWPFAEEPKVAKRSTVRGAVTDRNIHPTIRTRLDLAARQPCRLIFPVPLRLMVRKHLIEMPTLADIVVAACRRVKAYLPAEQQADWEPVSRAALDTARHTPAVAWQGQRLDLHRYSGRQKRELELRGVTGCLDLPEGPGQLWPLLAAARWLHLGKGTVMGMGQMEVHY
jgi:hypothetical protein